MVSMVNMNVEEREQRVVVHCSVCGKSLVMLNVDDPKKDKAYVALTLRFGLGDESEREFVQSMLGSYKIDESYHFCPECWLKAMGVRAEGGK